jgi:hypothetical protein
MSEDTASTVYVVRRLPHGDDLRARLAGPTEVATFADYESARADCADRERAARKGVNPFRLGGALPAVTSLDAPALHDWLLDAGLDPPRPDGEGVRDWAGWWDAWQSHWSTEQRDAAWRALDRVRFFEVVERRPRRKAYVVVEIGWWWNDDPPHYSDPEGGIPVEAFADRELAQVRRLELEAARRANNWFQSTRFELEGRGAHPGEYTLADVPLYEVLEVDWEGP